MREYKSSGPASAFRSTPTCALRTLRITGPAVSQHLRVLREAGLIEERRSGTRRLYRARPAGLAERLELDPDEAAA